MKTVQKQRRCQARTKAGKPCRAAATKGGRCFLHTNPKKASEMGRIGGRSKRYPALESADPLPPLDNVTAVLDTGTLVANELYSGKLKPGVAEAMVRVLSLQMRAIELAAAKRTSALEQRVAKLEKLSAEATADQNVDGDAADAKARAGGPGDGTQRHLRIWANPTTPQAMMPWAWLQPQ